MKLPRNSPIKILHIDSDYKVTYFIKNLGGIIHSPISLEQAISILKNENLDLIISEPLQKAILHPQGHSKQMDLDYLLDSTNLKREISNMNKIRDYKIFDSALQNPDGINFILVEGTSQESFSHPPNEKIRSDLVDNYKQDPATPLLLPYLGTSTKVVL